MTFLSTHAMEALDFLHFLHPTDDSCTICVHYTHREAKAKNGSSVCIKKTEGLQMKCNWLNIFRICSFKSFTALYSSTDTTKE